MSVLPSLSSLTAALRLRLCQQRLRPYCRLAPLLLHQSNHSQYTQSVLRRRLHPMTVSFQPPWSARHSFSALTTGNVSSRPLTAGDVSARPVTTGDVSARPVTTQTVSQEKQADGGGLPVQLKGREIRIPLVWLRDHCRCEMCYNASTFQKNVDTYSLQNLSVLQSGVKEDTLSITWQDGHITQYSLQWLADNFLPAGSLIDRCLWDGPGMNNEQLPVTPFDLHMSSEEGLKNTLSNIVKYGFCIVDGAPVTSEGTELVTGRISFPLETVYGRTSTMVSGEMTHSDTAYTNLPLKAHTDTSYFKVPAGIQVFHCLGHDGEGGYTLLVDGFHAAEQLRRTEPAAFQCLVSTPVPHEYRDGAHYHLYAVGTVLTTHPHTGQLTHIRFNPYDRAPLNTVPAEDMGQFYSSYEALTQIIHSKVSQFWVKLTPGMVLLVDNWRVMHGRSSFTGRRVLCSYYLPRDDWTSRARVMKLL